MFYFLVGSAVTRIGMEQKEAEGIAEKRSGARGPENVWGSALTGALCALGTLAVPALNLETKPLHLYYCWDMQQVSVQNCLIPVPVKSGKLTVSGYI